jgi:putative Mn2+ efflux pump MntP
VGWLNILGVAVALAMDAFAVSIAAGLAIARVTGRHVFRLAWHFGLFQFLMPVIGWSAGRRLAHHIHAYDHWVAFALLGVSVWAPSVVIGAVAAALTAVGITFGSHLGRRADDLSNHADSFRCRVWSLFTSAGVGFVYRPITPPLLPAIEPRQKLRSNATQVK